MNKVTLSVDINNETCNLGDVFLINNEPYILTSTSWDKLMLVGLKDGIRWDDPFVLRADTTAGGMSYKVRDIVESILNEAIAESAVVKYIGAVKIEVTK